MKKLLQLTPILILTLAFFSCQKVSTEPDQQNATTQLTPGPQPDPGRITPGGGCPPTEVTLIAGQTINAGTVNVTNDAVYIYVTYETANGYTLTQTHLYVGDCALVPVNNQGNPIPGHFPYSSTHTNITSFTYQVPISAISAGTCGCIAAHAVVVKLDPNGNIIEQQTGWGNGRRINPNAGNWGMKFDYCSCTP